MLAKDLNDTLWRQKNYLLDQLTKKYHKVRRQKHSNSSSESQYKKKQSQMEEVCLIYLKHCAHILSKGKLTFSLLEKRGWTQEQLSQLDWFITEGVRQIDFILRRVFYSQRIPHHEKVFSLFEPHTEWISKGKAGVPVELGLRVCVINDQFGFTLHHRVMAKETDDKVAVPMAKEALERFPQLRQVSYDKGFWSPENQDLLSSILERPILPKKGRLSEDDKARENHLAFRRGRRKHSAVESDINGLEARGLDKCRDSGLEGFKRYVAMAVTANNIHRLGQILMDRDKALVLKEAA